MKNRRREKKRQIGFNKARQNKKNYHNQKGYLGLNKDSKDRVGIFRFHDYGDSGAIESVHRKNSHPPLYLKKSLTEGLEDGSIVVFTTDGAEGSLKSIRSIGHIDNPKCFADLAVYNQNLSHLFSEKVINDTSNLKVPEVKNRKDYRDLPLVTIDGADAKDFDDAVYAIADNDPNNKGGWNAIVAIADVSHYVPIGSDLDLEAKKRGNSVYLSNKVVPMLPEALSNDLCSLRPNEDRACFAVELKISKVGDLMDFHFHKGLMRSHARLTYKEVEAALKGDMNEKTDPIYKNVILPLYGCFKSLSKGRRNRGTLAIERQEIDININPDNTIGLHIKPRLDSHLLIEELMIAANIAAAKTLEKFKWQNVYRIHDKPDLQKIENLNTIAKSFGFPTKKSRPDQYITDLNSLSKLTKGKPGERIIKELILRTQAQARYSTQNIGHFGLNLASYSHFTSPIRRYADLIVHRALVSALNIGSHNHTYEPVYLNEVCEHISQTERKAMEAEREVRERLTTFHLKQHLGEIFSGVIIGLNMAGIFVEVLDGAAQGFIAKQDIGQDFFIYDEKHYCYIGKKTKKKYQMGQKVKVLLTHADHASCSVNFLFADSIKPTPKAKTAEKLPADPAKNKKKPLVHKKKEKISSRKLKL